jgi:hypothetical protein
VEGKRKEVKARLFGVLLAVIFLAIALMGCSEQFHMVSGKVTSLRYSGLLGTVTTIYFSDGSEIIVDGQVIIEVGKCYTIVYRTHAGSISVISVVEGEPE